MRANSVLCVFLIAVPTLSMAFLSATVPLQRFEATRLPESHRKPNTLTSASMTYDPTRPDLSPRLLSFLTGAAGLAAPLVAGAKVIDRLAATDWEELEPETLESFFTEEALEREFQPIFNNLRDLKTRMPDCVPTENGYIVNIEAPGVKKEDLKVELVGKKTLIVSSGMKSAAVNDAANTDEDKTSALRLRKEVNIPSDADTTKMTMNYKDGLLTVDIPRIVEVKEADVKAESSSASAAKKATITQLEKEAEQLMSKLEQMRQELEIEKRKAKEAEEREAKEKAERARQSATERIELDIH